MNDLYNQLLEATIEHVKMLKARGQKYACVTPEILKGLVQASRTLPSTRRAAGNTSAQSRPESRIMPKQAVPSPTVPKQTAPPAVEPEAPTPAIRHSVVATPNPSAEIIAEASTVPAGATPKLTADELAERIAALRGRVLVCQKCPHLARARKNVVFGVGSIQAVLMFVGEAPGADEDEQGEPFVGKAGQLLTKIIQATGYSRADVYIANILKCRPDTPGQSAGNRKPTADEIQTCKPYLNEQIDLIQPRVIVALGATAVEGLLGVTTGITRLRGHFLSFRGVPVMPTYHPAYLLRNQSMAVKRQVWEDMLQVMEKLELPISEKQRQYFLPRPDGS